MPKGKKAQPQVDAVVTLVVSEGEDEMIANLTDRMAEVEDEFPGLTLVIGYTNEDDEDAEEVEEEDEEDEEYEDDEDDEEDEEDEDDEDAEEEEEAYSEEDLEELGNAELKELLEVWEIELDGTRFSKRKAIAAILEAQDEYYGEAEEDEDEEDSDTTEDEEEVLDEDALRGMSITELKDVYKEVTGKNAPKGLKKDGLVDKILQYAEDE